MVEEPFCTGTFGTRETIAGFTYFVIIPFCKHILRKKLLLVFFIL